MNIILNAETGEMPTDGQRGRIQNVLDSYDPLDLSCLVYACTVCGTIGMTHDEDNRNNLANNFDFTCHQNETYVFVSETYMIGSV
jgi:hypothetical protein